MIEKIYEIKQKWFNKHKHCPICHDTEYEMLEKNKIEGSALHRTFKNITLVKCHNCGYIHTYDKRKSF